MANATVVAKQSGRSWRHVALQFAPILLALVYPFLLQIFSHAVGTDGDPTDGAHAVTGWLCLFAAMAVPVAGLGWAYRLRGVSDPSDMRTCARFLAFLMIGAPPLYVFIGVTRGLIGRPLTDQSLWLGLWLLAIGFACVTRLPADTRIAENTTGSRLRVAHGVSASFILLFVAFHLINHLSGLVGPDLHAAIMESGRTVYRSLPVEILLIGLLLFQIVSGLTLAKRWSRKSGDGFRVLQIGSGIYLASFVITHLNSALVSARTIRHLDTNWAWASGGAEGLIHDPWNIRLVPHYAFGVFFVLTHLLLGLRQVLVAHSVEVRFVKRLWSFGMVACAVVAAAIMAGLLGLRL